MRQEIEQSPLPAKQRNEVCGSGGQRIGGCKGVYSKSWCLISGAVGERVKWEGVIDRQVMEA